MCVESFNHNQVCTLSDGSMLEASATLSELMEELKNFSVFVRPHRAYIVNMDFIRRLNCSPSSRQL
ncbi:LytTR family transcriptional regulator DNA-binding domain-containing protein, partial [Mediterraneibacter faecis]|uniref:LytTR family transcriptional regulator DNA-binding domain-containing protein n=1 Tax=Mediterraneibacter faecis TaxID=592978 RepID=UPI003B521657